MKRTLAALRAFLVGLILTGVLNPSFAASGITQITVKDAAGTTRSFNVLSDTGAITGNLMWNNVICDPTTTTQCAAVSAGGALSVSLPTGASTSALQGTNTATTAHTCSTAGYSELGCLGQIDDDVKATGTVNPGTAANWGIGATGAAVPANAVYLGITSGGNLTGWTGGVTVASGGIASGALASGSVASGAVASGAFASGSIGSGAIASGAVASGAFSSGAFASGSFLNATAGDPCMFQPKSQKNINTASGTTLLVAASGSTKVYVCSFALVAPSAVAVSLSEGTGATCNTANQAGVMGVAVNGTAANGMSLAANGGLTLGNGGNTVAFTATAANALCLFQSGTAQLAGNITYVQQ